MRQNIYINFPVNGCYESLEGFLTADQAKTICNMLIAGGVDEIQISDKEKADNDDYDPFIAIYEAGEWRS